ncbi:SDR family NAD(P)-dependent oxidoreductase [Chloroflexota bacterium]
MQLKDRVAIVTGGGSGIGQSTCLLLAEEGAIVAIGDIDTEAAATIASRIIEAGGQAMHTYLNAKDSASVQTFVEQVLHRFGRIDILVNNVGTTGTTHPTNVIECTEHEFDTTLARNVKSVFLMSRAVLPSMIKNRSGSVINISSAAGLVGRRNLFAYSAAKGAIIALTRAMAHDHGKDGIRVNCVCPGPTLTPALNKDIAASADPEAKRKAREAEQPLGRLGEPLDTAEAIVFLASDRASWLTGVIMPVDGGNTAI